MGRCGGFLDRICNACHISALRAFLDPATCTQSQHGAWKVPIMPKYRFDGLDGGCQLRPTLELGAVGATREPTVTHPSLQAPWRHCGMGAESGFKDCPEGSSSLVGGQSTPVSTTASPLMFCGRSVATRLCLLRRSSTKVLQMFYRPVKSCRG